MTSPAAPTATGWTSTTGSGHEGHHPGRRKRHAALSGNTGRLEAAAAGLRQADDLLPAHDADAGRHPRRSAHLYAPGHTALRTAARRRAQVGNQHFLRRAAL